MGYLAVPTVLTGDSWSAAQHNTYIKDNFATLWPYTAAGDLAYAATATTLARLAKGAEGTILAIASGVPAWTAPDVVHAIGTASNYAAQTMSSPTYADITSLTLTLVTTRVCKIFVLASILASTSNASYDARIRAVINASPVGDFRSYSQNILDNVAIIAYLNNVAAGSRICKLQISSPNSVDVTTFGGFMMAVAVPA